MVVVKVYGYLTDITGWSERSYVLEDISVKQLLELVFGEKDVKLEDVLAWTEEGRVRVLINGRAASLNDVVKREDEIAILPPSSGG